MKSLLLIIICFIFCYGVIPTDKIPEDRGFKIDMWENFDEFSDIRINDSCTISIYIKDSDTACITTVGKRVDTICLDIHGYNYIMDYWERSKIISKSERVIQESVSGRNKLPNKVDL